MEQVQWADRGRLLQPVPAGAETRVEPMGLSRMGAAQPSPGLFSFWIQLRGSSWIEAREGRFRLRAGEWIVLERDSRAQLQADRRGVCVGLAVGTAVLAQLVRGGAAPLHVGQGRMSRGDLRTVVRLWRRVAAAPVADPAVLRPLLAHMAALQAELAECLPRCPGRSRGRKQQVFSRLQRARLYLEGNRDRVVRIAELAELTSFSSWYFSKTFHQVYGESPQESSARLRLEYAAELLRETDMMIGEVAAACGFDNPCSFARAFRTRHGSSASAYRAAMRAGQAMADQEPPYRKAA
ncbi:AraC family transcriptional regulator [Lysobacter sp. GX 14042]|uniref:helix-turn-helix transcriptional regulator n=1 Tax=Lysobacter sp. GX 14042 TaxID=2907155 RepID=UPI001F169F19|nr:AraC family transcriptional regulator [Lysobacter sp. GX 14042]MCE7033525.1 AraC family transcriptional regulator [Lysobacter sp. GX 14042]